MTSISWGASTQRAPYGDTSMPLRGPTVRARHAEEWKPPTGNFYLAREPRKPYGDPLQLKEHIGFSRNVPHSAANLRKFMAQSRSAGSSGPGRVKVKTARSFVHLGTKRWDLDDDLDQALDSIPGWYPPAAEATRRMN